VSAWINRGAALGNLGEYKEAVNSFDKAIELKPEAALAWYNKACAYSKGDKEKSLENLRKTIELDPKYKAGAKKDEAFKGIWDDEDFKKIVE
jgi:tetratricopeptide (TPR) repeat protein